MFCLEKYTENGIKIFFLIYFVQKFEFAWLGISVILPEEILKYSSFFTVHCESKFVIVSELMTKCVKILTSELNGDK